MGTYEGLFVRVSSFGDIIIQDDGMGGDEQSWKLTPKAHNKLQKLIEKGRVEEGTRIEVDVEFHSYTAVDVRVPQFDIQVLEKRVAAMEAEMRAHGWKI